MKVVFIHGPPAAGKHTVATYLSESLGYPLFHNHLTVDLITTLFPFGTPEFIKMREDIWTMSFERAAESGTSFIFTFCPENTVDPSLICKLEAVVKERGGEVAFVELSCPDEVLVERMDSESRKKFGKLVSRELFNSVKKDGGFDFPPLPAQLTLDTSTMQPSDTAEKIAAFLSLGERQ